MSSDPVPWLLWASLYLSFGEVFCSPTALKIPSNCPLLKSFISGCLYCIFLLFISLLPLAAKSLPHLIAIWLGSIYILSLGTFQHATLLPFLLWGFTAFVTSHEFSAAEVSWSLSFSPSLPVLRLHLGLPTRLKYLLHVSIRFFWVQCLRQGYLGH